MRRTPPVAVALLVAAVALLSGSGVARAHDMWPASWHLTQRPDGTFATRWEVPLRQGQPLPLSAVLPEHCRAVGTPSASRNDRVYRVEQDHDCGERGLVGERISVEGLATTQGDVLVVFTHTDGRATTQLLRMEAPAMVVPEPAAPAPSARRYLVIGVEHIWTGIDHVLFVLGLVLVAGPRAGVLLKTVTAFTVAHSVTLALSTLGLVRMPERSVEAVIALSILLLAVEVTRGQARSWTLRFPWAVAGACGLVHGLGFAGALASIGLPEGEVPLALLNFNIGVEAGQLVVVAIALGVGALARRLGLPAAVRQLPVYAVGSVAAFWFFQRSSSVLPAFFQRSSSVLPAFFQRSSSIVLP